MEAHTSKNHCRPCIVTPQDSERGVQQILADKASGNLVGLWLPPAAHLRLRTWELLWHWAGQPISPPHQRLSLQLVQEAALCLTGLR